MVLPTPQAADAATLWIAATHAQPAWAHAPRLVIRGPEKRCGKSRLLDIVEALCRDPFITVNSSPAAVYRSISDDPPTMLVDEADTIFGPKADGNEDLRGLLNAGHQRNRPAKRYDAATNHVQSIPTFAMAALAGIGAEPDTIEDRAVVIRMRRRGPHESVAPYRHRRDRPPLRRLASQLTGWLRADMTALESAEPDMPVEDRAADTWEPLVAVADHAGAHWPDRSRAAVLVLTAEATDTNEVSTRIRLLMDCRTAFGDHDAIPTTVLLERLRSDREAPWADYGPTGLTAMKLGVLLRDYDIRSAIRAVRLKAYHRAHPYQPDQAKRDWYGLPSAARRRRRGMTTHTNRQQSGPPANERTQSMSLDTDNAVRLLLTIEEAADRLGIGRTLNVCAGEGRAGGIRPYRTATTHPC